eukprot:TRINITY_DN15969_c0_g1_i1.p2 TRINITY_DN15969_c0_g1~~TRINITY_DN15969_c0_g1_i1.p2  ORF type:complete len:105 (-),score=13.07 TRINITY_DN15969_c0_g1_i1:533-847(-)
MVTHFQIEQYGTCLSKDVFDPMNFDEANHIRSLRKQWKAEEEKRQKNRQSKNKIDFKSSSVLKPTSRMAGIDAQDIIQKAKVQAEAGVKKILRQQQQSQSQNLR